MSLPSATLSSIRTSHSGRVGCASAYDVSTAKLPTGWWEIPRYSAWDLGSKYACSQSTLVARRSHDAAEKSMGLPTVIPTMYPMQSTVAESHARVSFSQHVDEVPAASAGSDFGTGLGSEMGRAYRMPTLLNNPALIEQYHRAAKMTDDPEVQFEFAKQLLLCGSSELASNKLALNADLPDSRLVREGVFWILRLANKQHHKESCFLVGRWYELGKYGCKLNLRKAIKYYSTAAKLQHTSAHYHLGCVYELAKKTKRARECFETASKRGFSLASYRLGISYLSGSLGVVADFSMACSFLREALFHASHPVADAGYHLAIALIQLPSFDRHSVSEPHLYLKRAWMLGHSDSGALLRDILQ